MQKLRSLSNPVQLLTQNEIQLLVEELDKQRPNQKQIKKLFTQSGIDYTADPIEQRTSLLDYLQKYTFKIKSEKFLEDN